MIKFTAGGEDGKRKVLGFGITDGNIAEMKKGRPLYVNLEPMGLPGYEMIVMWGTDEEALTAQVKPFLSPETRVRVGVAPEHLPPDHPRHAPSDVGLDHLDT